MCDQNSNDDIPASEPASKPMISPNGSTSDNRPSTATICVQARTGDPAAIDSLAARIWSRLRGRAAKNLPPPLRHCASDLANSTLGAAFQRVDRLSLPWLFGILKKKLLKLCRRETTQKRNFRKRQQLIGGEVVLLGQKSDDPVCQLLEERLDKMGLDGELLRCVYVEQEEYGDVALRWGIKPDTLRKRAERALAKLRLDLEIYQRGERR